MPVTISARYWSTEPVPLQPDGFRVDLGEVSPDGGDVEGGVNYFTFHIALDPDPSDPERAFSSLDITGSLDDIEAFADWLKDGVEINREASDV